MNEMNEMPICDRRVQAYFQKNGPFKKPPPLKLSIPGVCRQYLH